MLIAKICLIVFMGAFCSVPVLLGQYMDAQVWTVWLMSATFGYYLAGPIYSYLLDRIREQEKDEDNRRG